MDTKRFLKLSSIVAFIAMILLVQLPVEADEVFFVNTTQDTVDSTPGNGICADASGLCSFRAALMESNSDNDMDTIHLGEATYVLTSQLPEISKPLTIIGGGMQATVIDSSQFRGLYAQSNITLNVSQLTIQNANPYGIYGDRQSILVVDHVWLKLSSYSGLYSRGTSLTVTNSLISNNMVSGIYIDGTAFYMDNTTIQNNSVVRLGWVGGGIRREGSDADFVISNSLISNNEAYVGGGISLTSYTANSQIGIEYTASITNTTISNNRATRGGGISFKNEGTIPVFNNVTITGNEATVFDGGGAEVLTVGGFVGQGGIFSNSIIAGNVGYLGVADDYNGALISAGYNIIGVVTNVAISGDITGNITNVDPILSVLDDTHGTLAVHIPQEGSPALDAGNDLTCETVDQRGLTRPLDGNGDESASCDIGAAERLPADSVDLAVSLASSHVRAARGEAITLVATVLNTGYVDASTIVVDIAIPSGLTVQSSSGDGNFVDGIWTIDAISDGQSATVEIIATVDVNAVGQVLRPSAILNSVQQTQLPTFNDMDVLSIRVEPSDAEITLQTSTDQPNAGDTFNYIATVINNGQYPLTNTVVALSFPDVVAVQSTDGNYVNGLWTVPTVPVNGRVSLTVTMLVEEENPAGTHSATALIQSVDQLDTLPLNDTASVNIVVHSANVSLSINNSDILAYRTMPFNMTFTLRNAGPNTASHLSVPVNLPDFVEVAHSTISRGTYENGVWTIESLANNAQATLTLNLIIAENTTPEIGEGDANVSADQWDSSTLNNNVTFSIEVIHIIDLELTKTVNFLSLYEGDQATYTLTLTNNGIDNATNIQVRDDLPNAVTYVSHVGGGSFDEVTGIWTVSELSAGDSVGLDLVVSVNNETLGQSITNIAEVVSVDQVDIDSTPDNGVVYYEDDIATADFEVCTSTPPVFEISANDVTGISEALQTINNGPCYDGSAVINLTPGGYNISSPYVGASSLGATAFPYIERDVIINGNGATFLRTNPSASYRYFVVQDSGSLTLNDVTIYFAKLSSGSSNYVRGGIVFNSGSVALNRVYVYSASTKGEGGIVYSVGENVEINQSTFEDISGARGAIIYRSTGDATFTNNTIYNVNLSSNGSLFENSTLGSVEDSFTISHNLITDVRGPNGTVLFFARQPIQLRANLVANNNNTTVSLCDGSTNAVSTGYNRFDRASNATCPEINSATDLFSADLVFAPLTYTGGTVVTGNLIPTSTWVDVIPAEECTQITEDQRGFSRPFDSDGDTIAACDIGPLEMRSGNFSISKTVDNATPMADEPYTFTIEVTNTSGMHLPTAFIYDPMNEQMAYVSSSATRGFYLADTGFWGIESFAPDETAVLTLTVVSSATVAPLEMINTAYVVTPFIASEPSASATVNVSCSTFSNWNIPDGDTDALIYAIEMAQNENCNPGANTITLAENGIYEVSTLYDGVNAFPTISSNIVIEGNGSIITRKNSFMRFFNVSDSLTLRDITLEDGYVASFITDNLGGAIYNTGTLLIENSTFDNNRARRGGAIYNNEGTLTIRNSAFLANWAQGNSPVAGAILNLGGTVLIESTDFIENKAHVSNSVVGSGGAIYNGPGLETSGTMTIRDSYFEGNDNIYRGEGGAIANVGSSSLPINTSNWVLVERSQFIENTSISGGGAINNKFGRVVVTESTFLDNNGDGGIYSSGELEVSNSTFSGTTGSNTGIQVAANSTATLEFNTIYSLGQGLYGDGEVIAYANIVDLRTLYTCGNLSITSLGHNIFSNDSCGFDHPNDLNNTDTLVAPLNNYGGNTLTHALLPNSPALDFVTDCHNLSIDQRGYLRPVDGDLVSGSLCDAGAFESQFVPSLGDLVIDLNTEIHIADLGDIVPFNLTLTNNGPDPIAGIAITVESHEGLTYFNHGGDGSFADGIWSIDAIAPNETKTLNFELEVMQLAVSATPHVFAEITGLSDIDPDVSNNVDHVHFYVRGANLFYGTTSISSSTSYATGEVEVYLQLHNGGPDSSSNVSVAIPLPEGLSVISYEGDGTFEDGSWSVGTLDLNEQSEIILVIEIDAGIAEQQLIISAIASSDTGDPVANNVREFTLDIVPASDIAVAITPMTQAVSENEIVNFTVNVTNNGPDVALLTTVALVYPQGLTLIAEDSDGALVGGQWTIAELEVGASAALNMTMQVDAGTDADVSVFEAIANAPLYDFDSSNNRAEFTAFVNPADLAIGINVSQLTPASGDSFTTMITVENATSLDVNNVFVSIALPSQVIYQSASGDGTYNNAVWHIDTIAAGDTATLQLNLLVANNRGGQPFTLSSEIISADRGDNNPDNDYAEESLQVAGADLSITLVPSQDLYQSGDTATFEMTITNNGPFASDAVQAFMGNPIGLPVGLQYVSHQGPGTFTINEEWYWNIDQIEPFTSVTLTINAEIGESMIGQTHHIYSRILQSSEPDSIPENDEALMLVVVDGAKFNLNITRSSGTPQPGERIYLTIIAGNYSDNLVDYAEIQLIVPEGLTYDGHSSSPYTAYDPETGIIALNDFINTLTQRIYFWVDEGTEGQHLEITANVINASVQYIANEASTILSVADAPSEPLIVNTTEDDFDGLCGVIHCSLRDAVYEANQMANGTVTLPAGHYTFTQAQQINITNAVTIEGEDAATTIIDGNNLARIFSVAYGAEFNLSDVTLQNGQVIASASPNTGSALYAASYAEVHLDHVIVQNNVSASEKAAIYTSSLATLDVYDSLVQNHPQRAIETNGTLRISRTTFTNNGTALYTRASYTGVQAGISNSTFSNNTLAIYYESAANSDLFLSYLTLLNNDNAISTNTQIRMRGVVSYGNTNGDIPVTAFSDGYNFIGVLPTNFQNRGDWTTSIIGVDPLLGELQANGGFGPTHEPLPNSPVINVIPYDYEGTSLCGFGGGDQQGSPRPVGPKCDIGAVEYRPGLEVIEPGVLYVSTVEATSDGVLTEGEGVIIDVTQIIVRFTEPMFNPAGDTESADVTNPANYQLIEAGADNIFNSDVCGSLTGDDTASLLNSITYDGDTNQALLSLNGGSPLPIGYYRLGICTSLEDVYGNPLNGDGNINTADVPFVLSFLVDEIQSGPVLTVTFTDDGNDGICGLLHCSLREALNTANTQAGENTIQFNLLGDAPFTIQPRSPLPQITDPVILDGWSQAGFAGVPIIELNGSLAGNNTNGLHITGGGTTIRGFVINRFKRNGIYIRTGGGNTLVGNYIGTNVNGTEALPNGDKGIDLDSPDNVIGGVTPQERNLISGNFSIGMTIVGDNNVIQGNFVGTDVTGTVAVTHVNAVGVVPRGAIVIGANVLIGGTTDVTPDGACTGACNLFSGNRGHGLNVTLTNSIIAGNMVGLDVTGTQVLRNGSVSGANSGIYLGNNDGLLIGGNTPEARNVISGNFTYNISGLNGGGNNVTIQGNYVGTDTTGMISLDNILTGIYLRTTNSLIGGSEPSERNIIVSGIHLNNGTNTVQGNFIGTDVTGLNTLRANMGISSNAQNNIIGGVDAGNVTTGGISLGSASIVQGNYVGVNMNGEALGNPSHGIYISGSDNLIGGMNPGEGNIVSYSAQDGVIVSSTNYSNNNIVGNVIINNGGLGINLQFNTYCTSCVLYDPSDEFGVTRNDPMDADTGGNGVQNYPILTSATLNNGTTTIAGSLNSAANSTYRVDLYANTVCDASGFGEGELYLGSVNVTTDTNGNGSFTGIAANLQQGQYVTVTATGTGLYSGTSEFSRCMLVVDDDSPTAPSELTISSTSVTQIELIWVDNAADESAYHIERSASGSNTWQQIAEVNANSTSYIDNAPLCETSTYRVRAFRETDGRFSLYSSAITAMVPNLCAPVALIADPDEVSIRLDWANKSELATNIEIEFSESGVDDWTLLETLDASSNNFTHANLTCESQFSYRLRAINQAQNLYSDYSPPVTARISNLCQPTNLTVEESGTTLVRLTWDDNSQVETDYVLERSVDNATWTLVAALPVDSTSYTDDSAQCSQSYGYRLLARSKNPIRNSDYDYVSVETDVCPSADLQLTLITSHPEIVVGNEVTFVATIHNAGLAEPEEVTFNFQGLNTTNITMPQNCEISNPTVICSLGAMESNLTSALIVTMITQSVGNVVITGTVSSEISDPNLNNNSVIVETVVLPSQLTQLSPIGTVTDGYGNLTYQWRETNATQYELYVARVDGTQIINPTV
ncbi:MAG: choice-of-anchor Q domain-containing protein, partial [Aggregatilineales bacterium]